MIQTRLAVETLKKANPLTEVEIIVIKTKGDLVTNVPLHKLNDKGVFVKEIEEALLRKDIDLAVHSMKDMPSECPQGLMLGAVQKGADPRDALVSQRPVSRLEDMEGMLIGTGSRRREYQLKSLIKDVRITGIRGNIETRMSKIKTEHLDAVVLAAAGLLRAGYEDRISYLFDPEIFIPSPCQGILALQIREGDGDMERLLKTVEDPKTSTRAKAEREYQRAIGGGCHFPVGAYACETGGMLNMHVLYGDEDGNYLLSESGSALPEDAQKLGRMLAEKVKEEARQYDLRKR